MSKLGYLHKGDIFIFDGAEYKAMTADGNGNAWVMNVKDRKKRKLSIDVDVEKKSRRMNELQ